MGKKREETPFEGWTDHNSVASSGSRQDLPLTSACSRFSTAGDTQVLFAGAGRTLGNGRTGGLGLGPEWPWLQCLPWRERCDAETVFGRG